MCTKYMVHFFFVVSLVSGSVYGMDVVSQNTQKKARRELYNSKGRLPGSQEALQAKRRLFEQKQLQKRNDILARKRVEPLAIDKQKPAADVADAQDRYDQELPQDCEWESDYSDNEDQVGEHGLIIPDQEPFERVEKDRADLRDKEDLRYSSDSDQSVDLEAHKASASGPFPAYILYQQEEQQKKEQAQKKREEEAGIV